jgi:hypothetical protein
MSWGILDTQDNVWIGNDDGPLSYDDEKLAQVACQMAAVQAKVELTRYRARELPASGPWNLRDKVRTVCTPEEALRRLEEGLI